jgi:hypothetical protein
VNLHGKIGGLPTWAWGLVLLGGLGVGLYLRRRGGSPTAGAVPTSTAGLLGAAGGGGSDGAGSAGSITGGIDPMLAQLVADSNSALVNESGVLAGLTGQAVDGALGAATTIFGMATSSGGLFGGNPNVGPTVTYNIGASPAGSSLAGTTTPTPAASSPLAPDPAPAAPSDLAGSNLTPSAGTFAGETGTPILSAPVDTAGTYDPGSTTTSLVDVTGHVVNAKGGRVGGAALEPL